MKNCRAVVCEYRTAAVKQLGFSFTSLTNVLYLLNLKRFL